MAYYKKCSCCGANLDPGEICWCQEKEERQEGVSIYDNGVIKVKGTLEKKLHDSGAVLSRVSNQG